MTAGSHTNTDARNNQFRPRTASLDFGGSSVKSAVLGADGLALGQATVEIVRYPFSPDDFVALVGRHLPNSYDRLSVGLPGVIRGGVVVHTPHYITTAGPGTPVDPELSGQWTNYPLQDRLRVTYGVPTLVVNDAQMAAAGVVSSTGCEVVLTLGTGLGFALIENGKISPHLEISHAPFRDGLTFDDALGENARRKQNPQEWSANIAQAIDALWPVFRWDRLYLGGGNAMKLTTSVRRQLKARGIHFLAYEAGAGGGAKLWDLLAPAQEDLLALTQEDLLTPAQETMPGVTSNRALCSDKV